MEESRGCQHTKPERRLSTCSILRSCFSVAVKLCLVLPGACAVVGLLIFCLRTGPNEAVNV